MSKSCCAVTNSDGLCAEALYNQRGKEKVTTLQYRGTLIILKTAVLADVIASFNCSRSPAGLGLGELTEAYL